MYFKRTVYKNYLSPKLWQVTSFSQTTLVLPVLLCISSKQQLKIRVLHVYIRVVLWLVINTKLTESGIT